jgi:hypothetical protein
MSATGVMSGGWWFRADRYEIRDGLIRPAAGAKIELYDPWAQHVPAPRRRRGSDANKPANADERPYQALLRLAHALRDPVTGIPAAALSTEQEGEVLKWCGANGLLGVLPHQVEMVLFPASFEEGEDWPVSYGYRRTPLGWEVETRAATVYRSPTKRPGIIRMPKLPERIEPDMNTGGVVLRSLPDNRLEREDLAGTWSQFFAAEDRQAAAHWPFPSFASKRFWLLYGEPVSTFVAVAAFLADPVGRIASLGQTASTASRDELLAAHGQINALAASASPALGRDALGSEMRWTTPSLLSSYAIMTAIDLAGGADVRLCDVCGSPFVTPTGWAHYCSSTCRTTQNKRINRKRRARSLELSRAGWDAAEIATEVDAKDAATVQRWIDEASNRQRSS